MWAPVVDTNFYAPAIVDIGYINYSSKWKFEVCCGEFFIAENFTIGGLAAVKFAGVISSLSFYRYGT